MKSPEEEADSELGKRLREKFEGFNAPVKDQVRIHVFAALDNSSKRFYWVLGVAALLFIAALFLINREGSRELLNGKKLSVWKRNKTENVAKSQEKKTFTNKDISTSKSNQKHAQADLNAENISEQIPNHPAFGKQKSGKKYIPENAKKSLLTFSKNTPFRDKLISSEEIKSAVTNETDKSNIDSGIYPANTLNENPADLGLLTPLDSVHLFVSVNALPVPSVPASSFREVIQKQGLMYGVKGVFSASVLQTFQLVHLSQSASDRVQNFQFAPLLSSKSLSYRFAAGIEKKQTQLIASYTYFRNWNAYEIGTNQVRATRVEGNHYNMSRIGEKHIEDERSHLIGIGIRQGFKIPQHILRTYTFNLGADYTRVLPSGQDLVWGNLGFYKQVYQPGGSRLEIGPYLQYSFIERKMAGQTWKSRPYQVGISVGLKLK